MPNAVIKAASERSGISEEKLEEIWRSAIQHAKSNNIDNAEAYANAAVQNATYNKAEDSNRTPDHNNFLHVKECVLTGEEVAEYLGSEIQGYQSLGLDANTLYGIYRPLEELEKAKDTFNNLPLTDGHIQVTPEKPSSHRIIGSTGTDAIIKDGRLYNSLAVWTARAQKQIQSADRGIGGQKDLSCGYLYDLVAQEGNFNGKPYKFKMINIRGNHVALVPEGRNPDAMIADHKPQTGERKLKGKFSIMDLLSGLLAGDKKPSKRSINMALDAICKVGNKPAEDFAGGEVEKANMIIGLVNALDNQRQQMAVLDEDPDEDKDKDKKGNDEDPDDKDKDKKGEDEEPEDKEEEKEEKAKAAADSAIRIRHKVVDLCTQTVGRMADKFLADSTPEQLVDNALTKNKIAIDGKSFDMKMVMLETLAAVKPQAKPKLAMDNKIVSKDYESLIPNRGEK